MPAGEFVLKTKYQTGKSDLEKKTPDTSWLVKKADYNAKISEIESDIPSISGLATTSPLTEVENSAKITKIEKKRTDHNHDKYVTTPEFNEFTVAVFDARLARANLITKADVDTKLIRFNKINSNKAKHLVVENEFKKLQTFDSIYFRGKSYFEEDGAQNYLVFQAMYRYFKSVAEI